MNQVNKKTAEMITKLIFHTSIKSVFNVDVKIPKNIDGVWYSQKYQNQNPNVTMQYVIDPANNYMSHIYSVSETGSLIITRINFGLDTKNAIKLEEAFIAKFDQPIKIYNVLLHQDLVPYKSLITSAIQLAHTTKWGHPIPSIDVATNELIILTENQKKNLPEKLKEIEI